MATKVYKAISFNERMNNRAKYEHNVQPAHIEADILITEPLLDPNTGRTVASNKYVKFDTRKVLKKFNVNDFALENLQAVGAVDKLTQTRLSGDVFESVDNIERTFINIEKSNSNK